MIVDGASKHGHLMRRTFSANQDVSEENVKVTCCEDIKQKMSFSVPVSLLLLKRHMSLEVRSVDRADAITEIWRTFWIFGDLCRHRRGCRG